MPSADNTNNGQQASPGRLNGWKEIAAYFGKGVRTVQRWEKELALPVHRITSLGGEIVYALRPELEAWQASAAGRSIPRDRGVADGGNGDPAPSIGPASPAGPMTASWNWRRRWPILAVLLTIGFAAAGTATWVRYLSPSASGQPHSFRIINNALAVFDADGRPLWERRFDFPLTESWYFTQRARDDGTKSVVFDDIDTDGNTEVLFVSEPWSGDSRGLFCFDHRGNLRFHHTPEYRVTFGEKTYGPPWRGVAVLATGAMGRPHDIWLVSTHLEEFPTVLEKLDAAGNLKGEYWSNGQISKVKVADVAGRPLVFVGALNNETKGASLAVLDAARPTGSAPAASDHYRCSGCPAGDPFAFLVFQRLDVTVVAGDYAEVSNVFVDALGQIMVDLRHRAADLVAPELRLAASTHYTLDARWRVLNAELGERVALVHAALHNSGLLDHPFSIARDSLPLWPVRRWNGTAFESVPGPESRR